MTCLPINKSLNKVQFSSVQFRIIPKSVIMSLHDINKLIKNIVFCNVHLSQLKTQNIMHKGFGQDNLT